MMKLVGVKKRYGRQLALDGLEMEVPEGAVYGFVGPNGAGKTTAIRLMCGLMQPDEGQVLIDGVQMGTGGSSQKRNIGYVPDEFGSYQSLSVEEYMLFFAACYGMEGVRTRRRIDMLLDMVELSDKKDMYVDALSRGMQQKLSLARALIHDPKLLILDEPTSGLDPGTRYTFRQLVNELAGEGKTVVISSHLLSEIAELCTDIGIIDHGKMLMQGHLEEVLRTVNASNPIIISLEGGMASAMRILRADALVRSISVKGGEIHISYAGDAVQETALLSKLVSEGIPVRSFSREKGNLEALFMQLTGGQRERQVLSYEAQADL